MKTAEIRNKLRKNQVAIEIKGEVSVKNFKTSIEAEEFAERGVEDYFDFPVKIVGSWKENSISDSDSTLLQDEEMNDIWVYSKS